MSLSLGCVFKETGVLMLVVGSSRMAVWDLIRGILLSLVSVVTRYVVAVGLMSRGWCLVALMCLAQIAFQFYLYP